MQRLRAFKIGSEWFITLVVFFLVVSFFLIGAYDELKVKAQKEWEINERLYSGTLKPFKGVFYGPRWYQTIFDPYDD